MSYIDSFFQYQFSKQEASLKKTSRKMSLFTRFFFQKENSVQLYLLLLYFILLYVRLD